ncbi:MAG: DUF554 domain-containing protein [Eubacterium sp.]|nr:DUF554 domain-containing protein [Eubacterium sp.]
MKKAVLFIGIAGALEQIFEIHEKELVSQGTMMLTISLAVGAVIGECLRIDEKMERFGEWLKQKTGNAKDNGFVDGFVTASLTVCIGAMAIIGSIEDGVMANPSILIAKGILDFVIILVMTASMGKGCMFSAVPVGLFQVSVTILAGFLKPFITDGAMANLSLVGSVLIFCVGVNLVWDKKIRVANLLPGLVIAVAWSFFGG